MSVLSRVAVVVGVMAIACGGSERTPRHAAGPGPAHAAARASKSRLEPARVMSAMRDNEPELRRCFFRAPNSSGFVRIGWHVDKIGAVQDVAVKHSTINNAEVETCLAFHIGELRFGELEHAAEAEWTYVFRLAEPLSDKEKKQLSKQRNKRRKSLEAQPGVVIEPSSEGSLEPEEIEQTVQSGFALFAHCYRAGIARNVSLKGWLRLRFMINPEGRVSNVLDGESDLPDRRVLDCVAESFYALKFPAPEQGSVRVLYRIELD